MEVNSFLTLLLALADDLTYNEGQARSIQVPLDSYDYIIVGAGATGATLAARLSQDLTTMVLLIDTAGSSTRPSDIPYIFSFWHLANTTLAHNYVTEKQPNVCHVTSDGECLLAVGRALGGGTAVNAMTYVRGNKLDYDSYAALGLPTWSYDKVLPFFKKFENSINIKSKYRGTDGPVNVTTDQWRFLEDLTNRWVSAGVEQYGVGQSDYNGKTQKAFSRLQRLIYRGIRQSTDRCYLQPLDQKRSNLHVLTYSLVTKVVFEGTKAIGVEYVSVREYDNNTKTTVKARKEVIISSGTFGSPKLLLLSGIGPKAHLDDVGIKVVAHRPGVGQNLQDPILVQVNFDTNKTYPLDGYITETNYRAWLTQGASILRSSTLCGLAFLPSIRSTSDPDDIRTEYTFDFVMGTANQSKLQMGVSYYSLLPSARGYVKLRSRDPMDEVVVDPKYLQGDGDMKEAISAMSALIKLAQAKAMREINMTAVAPKYAGCDSTPWSDDYIRCYLKVNAYSSYHFSGTCKMGNSSDPMAVIDDQLRVYGVQNLRVADGSIWPTVPRAHPTAPAIMVGEVLSSLISQGLVDQLTTSSQATMIDATG